VTSTPSYAAIVLDLSFSVLLYSSVEEETLKVKIPKSEKRRTLSEDSPPPQTQPGDLLTPSDEGSSFTDKFPPPSPSVEDLQTANEPVSTSTNESMPTSIDVGSKLGETSPLFTSNGPCAPPGSMFTFPTSSVEMKIGNQPMTSAPSFQNAHIFPNYPPQNLYQQGVSRYQPYPTPSSWLPSPGMAAPQMTSQVPNSLINQTSTPSVLRPFQPESPTLQQFPTPNMIPQIFPPFQQPAQGMF
jgi:hypothetical protein